MTTKNGNGTLWKIIGILITLSVIASSILLSYGSLSHEVSSNTEDITDMEPEVKKNSDHRILFEEKVTNMDKKIDEIHKKVTGQ